MKKLVIIFFVLFFVPRIQAQQSVLYTQFLMNDYGLNPAVAGSSKGWLFMGGRRLQWNGFPSAPESDFVSVTKDFGKKGWKYYWHGVGLYVEQDKFGAFTNKAGYASYAIHLKLSQQYFLSFGLAAGLRSIALNNILYDPNDPALALKDAKLLLYPEFVPGAYLYSKKITVGVSVKNLYRNTLQQGNKKIGTPSKLAPVMYATVSKKFRSPGYDFTYVPAIQIQSSFRNLPLSQFNFMAYYRNRIGLGLAYRMHDAVSGIIQFRIFDNLVVGFAYDYTVSRFRSSKANSTEIMIGFFPMMGNDDYPIRNNVAECPKFDF